MGRKAATRKRWKGDEASLLPAQKMQPYLLWFQFLQLALKDPTITVDKNFYRPWGDVENQTFDQWWPSHWRDLFAVDIGVHVVQSDEPFTKKPGKELIVRIPLYQSPKRSLAQIVELLEQHGASDRLKDMTQGQFRLRVGDDDKPVDPSTRFLRNLSKIKLLMHLYRFWLSHEGLNDQKRLERTALSYFRWADAWNKKVREKGWRKRTTIEIPFALSEYVRYLEIRGSKQRLRLHTSTVGDVSDHRRQITRYIRKARKIASNVAEGRFPGRYE